MRKLPVRSGERFAVQAECLRQGSSVCLLTVRWQREDGQWTQWSEDKTFTFQRGQEKWEKMFGLVTVPDGAELMVIMPVIRQQLSSEDVCWFDNVKVYKLSEVR